MKKLIICMAVFVLTAMLCGCFGTHVVLNEIDYANHKIDEATDYKTIKKVEDTCRAMISSYESDKTVYEQYKDSDDKTKNEWAEQAKMRANKTASTYNNYILENSFVWANNVPKDIDDKLEILK